MIGQTQRLNSSKKSSTNIDHTVNLEDYSMSMSDIHQQNKAQLAPDGIPLHYGDLIDEYDTGLNKAALLDRSHEGRIQVTGIDRYDWLNRIFDQRYAKYEFW